MATFDQSRPEPSGESTAEKKASHDTPTPQALLDFMVTGWKPAPGELPEPIEDHESFRARRRALSAKFPGAMIVVPTGHEKIRSNDTFHRCRPSGDFYYLTG